MTPSLTKAIAEAKEVGSQYLAVWIYEIEDLVAARKAAEQRADVLLKTVQAFIIEAAFDMPFVAERLENDLMKRLRGVNSTNQDGELMQTSNGSATTAAA
jgi:hypothetical protein